MIEITVREFFISTTDPDLTVVPHLSFIVSSKITDENMLKYVDAMRKGLKELKDNILICHVVMRLMTRDEVQSYRDQEGLSDDIVDEDDYDK